VVEVSWVRLTKAMEATVDIRIQELAQQHHRNNGGGGLDLSVSAHVARITEEIKLFRGVVAKPCALDRILVAVSLDSDLILHYKAAPGGGSPSHHLGDFAFRVATHGSVRA